MFHRTVNIIAVSSLMAFLAIVAVMLRFAARRARPHSYVLDDLLVVVGLLLSLAICVCNIVGAAVYRFGDHEIYNDSGPEEGFPLAWLLLGYGKIFYALQILHCCAMPIIKGSFLVFLRKTFGVSRKFRIALWIVGGYVFAWWFVTFWMTIFQCWPISYNWGTSAAEMGSCIPHYVRWYAWTALLNVLSDIAIIILPLPEVWKLSMSYKRKVLTSLALSSAALVIVAGIGRTVAYFEQEDSESVDFTYSNYYYIIWTSIEPCLGVVSVCLPRLRPLATKDGRSTIFGSIRLSFRSLLRTSRTTGYQSRPRQSLHSHDGAEPSASQYPTDGRLGSNDNSSSGSQTFPRAASREHMSSKISRQTDVEVYAENIPLKDMRT